MNATRLLSSAVALTRPQMFDGTESKRGRTLTIALMMNREMAQSARACISDQSRSRMFETVSVSVSHCR